MIRSAFALVLVAFAVSIKTVLAQTAPFDFLGAYCTGTTCDNGMECLSTRGGLCISSALEEYACTCGGAGGEADPYFTGFSGQQFYFAAEAGNVYNLLSEKDHLVNAEFVDNELPAESDLVGLVTGAQNSSFIGAVGLQRGNTTVAVACDRAGILTMSVDGKELELEDVTADGMSELHINNNITVIIGQEDPLEQRMVSILTDLVVLSVFLQPVHLDNMGNEVRGHLDVQMGLRRTRITAPPAHGVLGQTVDPSLISHVKDAFPGVGLPSDYIVSDLFASDYQYNMFGVAVAAPRPSGRLPPVGVRLWTEKVVTSRRMLDSHSQQSSPLLMASSGRQLLKSRLP